jgi:hypothetical protein
MLILVVGVVGIATWALALAWIADGAASRGRSQIAWVTVAVLISATCWLLAGALPFRIVDAADRSDSRELAAVMLSMLLPALVPLVALLGLGLWLRRQPVQVRTVRVWPVSCRIHGEGRLEITGGAVRLTWQDHTQDIPLIDVRIARPDGECLRLAWSDGELVLAPMLPPQNRDGRIKQSQILAQLLAPAAPATGAGQSA